MTAVNFGSRAEALRLFVWVASKRSRPSHVAVFNYVDARPGYSKNNPEKEAKKMLQHSQSCDIHPSLARTTPRLKIIFLQHYVFWLGLVLQQNYARSFRLLWLELTGETVALDSALALAYIQETNMLLRGLITIKKHHRGSTRSHLCNSHTQTVFESTHPDNPWKPKLTSL